MKKWTVILLYLLIICVAFSYKNEIIDLLRNKHLPLAAAVLIAGFFSFFPVAPFSLIIGILGFVYGSLWGAAISWAGSLTASFLMFLIVRYFFRRQGREFLSRYEKVERLTEAVEREPFISVLASRLLPLLPQHIINTYMAVSSVPFLTFVIATAVGKIPGMLVYAYVGGHMLTDWKSALLILCIYAIFLLILVALYKKRFTQ